MIKFGDNIIRADMIKVIQKCGDQILVRLRGEEYDLFANISFDDAVDILTSAGLLINPPAGEDPIQFILSDEELFEASELQAQGFSYMARDKDDKLFAFVSKPDYDGVYWSPKPDDELEPTLVEGAFAFISADDDEPTAISDLLTVETCDE
ncbi:MAG: hypothetical protein IJP43_07690 [Oscillospiraceae bacterium]|nr:hypothetical protein [Oscillospiraceae bacterium]